MLVARQTLLEREYKAASLIASAWKRYFTRKWYMKVYTLRNDAARRIARTWFMYRFLNVGPKLRKARIAMSATTIQKYMRGYAAHKKSLY